MTLLQRLLKFYQFFFFYQMQNLCPLFQTVATSCILSLLPRNLAVVTRPSHTLFFFSFLREPNKRSRPCSNIYRTDEKVAGICAWAIWSETSFTAAGKLARATKEGRGRFEFVWREEKRKWEEAGVGGGGRDKCWAGPCCCCWRDGEYYGVEGCRNLWMLWKRTWRCVIGWKWRQLIGCGRPKDQETVCFFSHGSTSVSEDSLSKKMFFVTYKIMFDREKISKSHKRDFQKSGLLPSSPSLPWPGIYPYHSTIAFFPPPPAPSLASSADM